MLKGDYMIKYSKLSAKVNVKLLYFLAFTSAIILHATLVLPFFICKLHKTYFIVKVYSSTSCITSVDFELFDLIENHFSVISLMVVKSIQRFFQYVLYVLDSV